MSPLLPLLCCFHTFSFGHHKHIESSYDIGGGVSEFVMWFFIALITLRFGRRWWLLFQGVLTVFIASMTLASPHFSFGTVMGSLIGDYDECHNIVIRAYAILFLVQGGILLFYQNSTDKRGLSAILEGLFVAYALEIIRHIPITGLEEQVGTVQHHPEKSYPFFFALMLGNFVHLLVGESGYRDFKTPSACNFNSRLDALALLLIGASLFTYPTTILALMTTKDDFDASQVVTMSVVGCYTIGNSVVSFQAESFTQDATRRNMYLVRIIECAALSSLVLLYWTFTDILTAHSLLVVPMYGIQATNAYIAMINVQSKVKE